VEDPSDIDDLQVFNYGLAVVEATADETDIPLFEVKFLGEASIEGESTIGLFTVDGIASFSNTAVDPPVDNFHTVDEFQVSAQQVQNATGSVSIGSNTNVTALSSSRIGDFFIDSEATFILDEDASLLAIKSLFIEKDSTAPEGILDLTDNAMIVDYSGDTPVTEIYDYIEHAYNNAEWDDFGLTSSTAFDVANNGSIPNKTALGYAEATDLFSSFPATWQGQNNVDNSSVLVKYTFYGDANLSGHVNLADFNRMVANFGLSEKRWSHGDFNYNPIVNLPDFNLLANNFGAGGLGGDDSYTYEELQQMLPD
jgi:hypothetical protein